MAFGKKNQQLNPVLLAEQQRMREQQEVHSISKGVTALRDFIAPVASEFSSSFFQIGTHMPVPTMSTGIRDKFILVG